MPIARRWPLLVLLAAAACGPNSEMPRNATERAADVGYQTSQMESLRVEGREAYERHCLGCHGVNGDGAGEAARFLDPKPRNFVEADFKFSSTRSGELPTDADLARSIKKGLRGSAMPTWDLLPDRTVEALIVYIKTFSPKWHDLGASASVPFVEDPYRTNPDRSAAVARGEAIYHGFAGCWNCHPSYVDEPKLREYLTSFGNDGSEVLRADLPHVVGKENPRGEMVYPPDFLRDFVRGGAGAEDIYRSVAAGITGTAMPTWVDSMDVPATIPGAPPLVERADLWAVAYYVQSLIARRPAKLRERDLDVRPRPRTIAPAAQGGAPVARVALNQCAVAGARVAPTRSGPLWTALAGLGVTAFAPRASEAALSPRRSTVEHVSGTPLHVSVRGRTARVRH